MMAVIISGLGLLMQSTYQSLINLAGHLPALQHPLVTNLTAVASNREPWAYPLTSTLERAYNLDAGVLMSVFYLSCFSTTFRFIWAWVLPLLSRRLSASIEFIDSEVTFRYFAEWIKDHDLTTRNTRLMASASLSEPDRHIVESKDGYFSFRAWHARPRIMFTPAPGKHVFWHNGRFFVLRRDRKDLKLGGTQDTLTITNLGRSQAPVKDILQEAQKGYWKTRQNHTIIYRPGGSSGHRSWRVFSERHNRPIESVILNEAEKSNLLKDINNYLDPETAEWYFKHGIPYRRGYLFHGPPGTGKTSMSFVIAGRFGLNLYCVCLADSVITEEDLQWLMAKLPPRCVVLLEDIDAAGLVNRARSGESPAASETCTKSEQISLSGFLNAIDGVASHEGRLLFLTTNRPENLDKALTRPGRVDVKVQFILASRSQIAGMFSQIFAEHKDTGDGKLADEFAKSFDDGVWSPAAVQGYLLERKDSPMRAVEEIDAWMNKMAS